MDLSPGMGSGGLAGLNMSFSPAVISLFFSRTSSERMRRRVASAVNADYSVDGPCEEQCSVPYIGPDRTLSFKVRCTITTKFC